MKLVLKFTAWALSTISSGLVFGAITAAGFLLYEAQELPDVDDIMTTRLAVPMRVYSADGELMSEFGKQKRDPVTYSDECWALVDKRYGDPAFTPPRSMPEPATEEAPADAEDKISTETAAEMVTEVAEEMAIDATLETTAEDETLPESDTNSDLAAEPENSDSNTASELADATVIDCRRRMQLVQAFISAEDDQYFNHPGVDAFGLLRAVGEAVQTRSFSQGGSTITMQLPRNIEDVGLSRDQRLSRKIKELMVAFQLEQQYTKKEILERYLNVIYMGKSAYGVVTAAQRYYGKTLDELTLAQVAMLAGLPKKPGDFRPDSDAPDDIKTATNRRNYVLRRMNELGYITENEFNIAKAQPLTAGDHLENEEVKQFRQLSAGYMAEMARLATINMFGPGADEYGLNVYTTVDSTLQTAANDAVFRGLLAYDQRHGYRGALDNVQIDPQNPNYAGWDDILLEHQSIRDFVPALVTQVNDQSFAAYVGTDQPAVVAWEQIEWARPWLPKEERTRRQLRKGIDVGPELETAGDAVAVGDVVLLRQVPAPEPEENAAPQTESTDNTESAAIEPAEAAAPSMLWKLSQRPEAQSAFVAVHPKTGAIQALVGGIEFLPGQDEFNRAVQSLRQPGSSFKPFIYSAALKFGYSPPTIVNDAPVVLPGYKPNNANHKIDGPTTVRDGLRLSKNLVAIRLVQAIAKDGLFTFEFLIKHLERFNFDRERMPRELGLALGTAQLSPLELANAYTVFATDGYHVPAYFIERIEDREGNVLYEVGDVDFCAMPCRRDGYYEEEAIERTAAISGYSDFGEEDLLLPDLEEVDFEEEFGYEIEEPETALPTTLAEAPPPIVLIEPVDEAYTPIQNIEPRVKTPRLAPQVVEVRNSFMMKSMMRGVVTGGTARAALKLKRSDVYGKTGTTNDQRDAWFAGFSPELIGVAWVGFDKRRFLGRGEYGGDVALPIWVDFMQVALKDQPVVELEMPTGITQVRVNRKTGEPASRGEKFSRLDFFPDERLPIEFVYQKEDDELRRKNPDEAPPDLNATELVQDIFAPPPEPEYIEPDEFYQPDDGAQEFNNGANTPLFQSPDSTQPETEGQNAAEDDIRDPSIWR